MTPVHFHGENGCVKSSIVDPVTKEPAAILPVQLDKATNTFVSMWKPSPEELQVLVCGGVVSLLCQGGQPICAVGTVPSSVLVEEQ